MKHIIVGNGVTGVTAAQNLVGDDPSAEVHIFGAEPYPYYRRPSLWKFIAGQIEQDEVFFRPADWYAERGIQLHLDVQGTALDPSAHRLILDDGTEVHYDRLLIATGARAFIPPCEGTDKAGVFSLRTLDDALAIKTHARKVDTAVVVGGGLLGLETARALHTANLDVTVVEVVPYLLPRQLDEQGADVLQSLMEAQGLHIITGGVTEEVTGDEQADGVQLEDGRVISGELILFSTGIRCKAKLARDAGLEVNRGIVVDEQLQTRQTNGQPSKDIFAAGDVAEFDSQVYGIIPAAIEQARVAATNMLESGSSSYTGTLPATTLKVAGAELTSLGESTVKDDNGTILRHKDLEAGLYRKLVLCDGRIIGAILLNDRARIRPITQLIERGVDVSAHQDSLLDDDFDPTSLL